MREKFSVFILFIFLALFLSYVLVYTKQPQILEMVTPTVLQVDLNGNNVIDDGEVLCLQNIETFTSNLRNNSEDLAKQVGISFPKSLAIGYLTDIFVNTNIVSKSAKVRLHNSFGANCRHADIYIDGQNYANILVKEGFAINSGNPVNPEAFERLIKTADKMKLVIMNHKSHKYHTLNCKYGLIASDTIILPEKEIPKDAKPCKFCHVEKHLTKGEKANYNTIPINIPPPPNSITDGSFKLILTDFTTILIPDRACSHLVCKEFVKNINNANSSIDMAIYGWANIDEITYAIKKAQNRGVKIRIVYDTQTKGGNYYPETEEFVGKFSQKRSDFIEGKPNLTNALMHNKFAIFDGKTVFTGSMNFSTTGLSGFNHNNVVVINSTKIAALYEKEFEQMLAGKFHSLKSKTVENKNIKIGENYVSVYFSPQDKGFFEALVPLINSAKTYIYVPNFLFTHPKLVEALKDAHRRGLNIKMITDATNIGTRHSAFKDLRHSGIPIKVENYAGKMHAKAMIIDDEYLVLGSTNFSNSAENRNDENMLIIKSPRLTKLYKDYFEYFWVKIPDKYLKYSPKAESKNSVGSCSDGIDNDFDGKIDLQDEDCR